MHWDRLVVANAIPNASAVFIAPTNSGQTEHDLAVREKQWRALSGNKETIQQMEAIAIASSFSFK